MIQRDRLVLEGPRRLKTGEERRVSGVERRAEEEGGSREEGDTQHTRGTSGVHERFIKLNRFPSYGASFILCLTVLQNKHLYKILRRQSVQILHYHSQ